MPRWLALVLHRLLVVVAVMLFLVSLCVQLVYEFLQSAKRRYQRLVDDVYEWTL
jgi:hypothetical protein